MVLLFTSVHSISTLFALLRRCVVGSLLPRVLPVCTRCHESAISLVLVVAVSSGGVAVKLTSLGVRGLLNFTLRSGQLLGRIDHAIVVAARVVGSIVAEKSRGALGLTTETSATAILSNRVSKDATLERVLVSLSRVLLLSFSEGLTCEGV